MVCVTLAFKGMFDYIHNRKMDEREKKEKKLTNDTESNKIENKAHKMTLGNELLEKEFERQRIAKELLAKHKKDKDKSNHN